MADDQAQVDTYQETTETRSGWRSYLTLGWVRTPIGLLKIVECVVLVIALIIMGSLRNVTGTGISSIEFFMFVSTTSWIFVLITIILYAVNVYHRIPGIITSNIVMVVVCGKTFSYI